MKRLPKEETESRILKGFLKTQPHFRVENFCKSEEPDFILTMGDGILGVEITGILEESRQRLTADWHKIADLCEKDLSTRRVPVVYAHIMFNEHRPPRSSKVSLIAKQIADCIAASLPADQESVTIRRQRHPNGHMLPREVGFVSVGKFDNLGGASSVNIMDGGFPRILTRAIIQQRIDEKNAKLPVYHRKCKTIWLVIAYELGGVASLFKLEEGLLSTTFTGGFDRAFLFNGFAKKTFELRIQP